MEKNFIPEEDFMDFEEENPFDKWSKYKAENIKGIFSEYIAENLDTEIKFSEYIAENLD